MSNEPANERDTKARHPPHVKQGQVVVLLDQANRLETDEGQLIAG